MSEPHPPSLPEPVPAPLDTSGTSRRLLMNTFYRSVADIGSKLASVALYAVMAREIGEAGFGIYTFAFSFAALVTTLADFGQDAILTREVARDKSRLDRYFSNTLALKLVAAAPVVLVAGIALRVSGSHSTKATVVVLIGAAVLVDLLTNTCFSAYEAYERLSLVTAVLITQRFLTAAIGIAALTAGAGVVAVAAIYLTMTVVAFSLATYLLRARVARPSWRVTPRAWGWMMRAALPVGLAGAFGTLFFRADIVMLDFFKSESVVGHYGAAYRLLETTLFLAWSVGSASFPAYSRLTMDTTPSVKTIFERSLKLALVVTLPLAVGAAVMAEPVVTLVYGPDFEDSAHALVLLAPTIALYPLCYLSGYFLVSQNRQTLPTIIYAVFAVENILANLVLIPRFSLYGAAAQTSMSQLLVAFAMLLAVRKVTGSLEWKRVLIGPLAGAAAAGIVMYVLNSSLVAGVVAGGLVYALVTGISERLLWPEDARALVAMLRRRAGSDGSIDLR